MENHPEKFDVIVVGAGMGGLTAASLLSQYGLKVLVLEAAHVSGGCSSSYYRKGYTFESGATTLIGFDENQPLKRLEEKLGIEIRKEPIDPSMQVLLNGKTITRWRDREKWLNEAIRHFGEPAEQRQFWAKAFEVSDIVWKVSGKNHFFPPIEGRDWLRMLQNNPLDARILPYASKSVRETAIESGISNPEFFRFLDEQLMISAQSVSDDTPFLFGAPAITYTNYTNYYVPGGLLNIAEQLVEFIEGHGGKLNLKEKVLGIESDQNNSYKVFTSKKRSYRAGILISNLPVWNMQDITTGSVRDYFKVEASKYSRAWGAFTMGVVTDDDYAVDMPLHHQIHFNRVDLPSALHSDSLFVSFSRRGDTGRAPEDKRVLNISAHTETDCWFNLNGEYDAYKQKMEDAVLEVLRDNLPGFRNSTIHLAFSATPVSWSNWVYRKKGRVGGIPQSMTRSLLDWTPNQTPFNGLYLCGDTVYPGQGIPGVTLSGFNVYYRVIRNLKKTALTH